MSMRAVVIKEPYKVVVEDRPIPEPINPTDAVVKVSVSGLCGSDLHIYHGADPVDHYDFILGHEFVGTIHSVGSAIKNFKKGDKVVSPFTTCCGNAHPPGEEDCFFCARNQTGRCPQARCFGSDVLDGAQAEYVRVELADSTLYEAPTSVPEECLVLMADIAPTGYFVAENAYKMLNEHERNNETTAVVIGCGPVGLCAVTAAKRFFTKVYALDMVADRLEEAKKHGATDAFNLSEGDIAAKIKELTGGRGADVALEVVGAAPALYTAVSLVRNFGVVSSCGIHTQPVTMQGLDLYNKNLRFQFGRCPVRAVFEPALKMVADNVDVFSQFIQHSVPIERAAEMYELFDQRKVRKCVFTF